MRTTANWNTIFSDVYAESISRNIHWNLTRIFSTLTHWKCEKCAEKKEPMKITATITTTTAAATTKLTPNCVHKLMLLLIIRSQSSSLNKMTFHMHTQSHARTHAHWCISEKIQLKYVHAICCRNRNLQLVKMLTVVLILFLLHVFFSLSLSLSQSLPPISHSCYTKFE